MHLTPFSPAAIVAGRISDRIGRKPLSLILLPLAALSIVGIVIARSPWALIAVLILYGLVGKLTWDPIATSWVGDRSSIRNPEGMGTAMGQLNFSGMLSAVIAPTVSGWITDTTGSLDSALYLAAALLLVGALLVTLPEETIKKRSKEPIDSVI
jgi:MFS family permease